MDLVSSIRKVVEYRPSDTGRSPCVILCKSSCEKGVRGVTAGKEAHCKKRRVFQSQHNHPLQRVILALAENCGPVAGGRFVFAEVENQDLIFIVMHDVL